MTKDTAAVVFFYSLTFSITQPCRTTVKVGRKVYSSMCVLSLGLEKKPLFLAKALFWRKEHKFLQI